MVPYKKTSASHTRYGLLNIINIITARYTHEENFLKVGLLQDRLCGLVVRVSGYRYRDPGFDSRRYQIF